MILVLILLLSLLLLDLQIHSRLLYLLHLIFHYLKYNQVLLQIPQHFLLLKPYTQFLP
ncbi:hypothetical protein A0H76_2989 [Hepatospora eriocheir]|uniref:Uncharacterized protein n=1 Tax=Hepatospora eriocheir TaxID=1081669 RepID=A0A1X0QGP0_9MICR|nr:hypothetical protein A0H76_2989 [Hepatospora eriocheir]